MDKHDLIMYQDKCLHDTALTKLLSDNNPSTVYARRKFPNCQDNNNAYFKSEDKGEMAFAGSFFLSCTKMLKGDLLNLANELLHIFCTI
jgi:hypothetical protein